MSDNYESDNQVLKQELIEMEIEHMQVNSSEIEGLISLLVSDIARLYCMHRCTPEFGRLVEQIIDLEIQKEGVYRGQQLAEERVL